MKFAILGPIFYLSFVFIIFYSCELMENDTTKTFVPGTYVRHYVDEYTNSWDTIVVSLRGKDTYLVRKVSSYKKLGDQLLWLPGSEIKKWLGTYEKETGSIFIIPGGKRIFFDPANNELKMGAEPYKKLKQ